MNNSAPSNGEPVRPLADQMENLLRPEGQEIKPLSTWLYGPALGWRIKDAERKVFLIVDNLRTHYTKKVNQWVEKHKDEIELFFLPAHSPELNPDEYVNNDVKTSVKVRPSPRNQQELQKQLKIIHEKIAKEYEQS
jgi:hypothetical protein